MNKRDLIRARTANKAKLEPSSWKNINRIEIDIGNSIEHEIAKCICFILLRNGVPAEQLPHLVPGRICGAENPEEYSAYWIERMVEEYGIAHGLKEWQRPVIVSEARFKDGHRADLYVLNNDNEVEIILSSEPKKLKENQILVRI